MKNKNYTTPEIEMKSSLESNVLLASGVVNFNPDWLEEEEQV